MTAPQPANSKESQDMTETPFSRIARALGHVPIGQERSVPVAPVARQDKADLGTRQQIADAIAALNAAEGGGNLADLDDAGERLILADAVLPIVRAAAAAALADVLNIVSEVAIEANDIGGVDINDLVDRLAAAGHPLPDDEPTA